MRHINRYSDFVLKETFKNSKGSVVDISGLNIILTYYTTAFSTFVASQIAGQYVNCKPGEKGELYILFDNHKLANGPLLRDVKYAFPSGVMADGILDIHLPENTDIEIWEFESDKHTIESEIIKDYSKGDTGPQGPKGDKGDTGNAGVQVSDSEPTDPDIKVWLNPNGKAPEFATKEDLKSKQDVLKSGENIKTINGESILGEGNIDVGGGSGSQGPKGDPGADGKSAYQIAVENGFVGTEQQWLDSLKGAAGPQGPKGETGAKGDKGNIGAAGAQGMPGRDGRDGQDGNQGADGKSAYQIAVENGFRGTEQQWLDSLKGDAGSSGIALSETPPEDPNVKIWLKLPLGS